MVQRLIGKSAVSASKLSRETGIRQQNLSRWLEEVRSLPTVTAPKRPKTWSLDDKIRILSEAAKLSGEELTALLERNGLRLPELEQWRASLEDEGLASKTVIKRIRSLERELARKEKALAEAAALLMLKKKLHEALGDEDDDTDDESEK
jgi:hypothetical protein